MKTYEDSKDNILTENQAAAVLKVSPRTLQAWRCTGKGPRFLRLGRTIRYRMSDLIEFTQSSLVDPA